MGILYNFISRKAIRKESAEEKIEKRLITLIAEAIKNRDYDKMEARSKGLITVECPNCGNLSAQSSKQCQHQNCGYCIHAHFKRNEILSNFKKSKKWMIIIGVSSLIGYFCVHYFKWPIFVFDFYKFKVNIFEVIIVIVMFQVFIMMGWRQYWWWIGLIPTTKNSGNVSKE